MNWLSLFLVGGGGGGKNPSHSLFNPVQVPCRYT